MWLEMIEGGILLGSFVYHRLADDHTGPKPNEINVPRTDQGAPIPLIYGRCRVRAPVLVWFGNKRAADIGGGQFIYYLDMLFVPGIPFYGGGATIHRIFAGDVEVTYVETGVGATKSVEPGRSIFTTTALRDFQLFGGDSPTGIEGHIEFFDGNPTQKISDGVSDSEIYTWTDGVLTGDISVDFGGHNLDPTLIPGYRNQTLCSLWGWQLGLTSEVTSYSFEVESVSTGTAQDVNPGGARLPFDADPAAVIYDLLVSPWGKLSLPTSKVDLPSFAAASARLSDEQHGYSRAIEQAEDARAIIGDVLKQIDGLIYEEPTTGKIVLKLIRNDYVVATLDDLNPGNMQEPESGWYQVQGWSETINQVRVTFPDRDAAYADGLAIGQNSANVVAQGGKLRSSDLRFAGCCTTTLARKLASRELAVVSRPVVKATVTVNRSFYATRPGDVLTLTWPELGIDHMIMRVARVDLGQLAAGQIKLEMIRDMFDVSFGAFPVL